MPIAQFKVSNDSLTKLKRQINNPNDCVLVALNVVGLISNYTHAIVSTLVDEGIYLDQILDIFKYKSQGHNYEFSMYNSEKFHETVMRQLKPGRMMFCGARWKKVRRGYQPRAGGHAMLIANVNNDLWVVDPQNGVFGKLSDPNIISQYVETAFAYFILNTSDPRYLD